jgi:hypothetical protein
VHVHVIVRRARSRTGVKKAGIHAQIVTLLKVCIRVTYMALGRLKGQPGRETTRSDSGFAAMNAARERESARRSIDDAARIV